jgi:hypothetical protein
VPASTVSPVAEPFFPGVASADRAMVKRWMDFSDDDDNIDEVIDTRENGAAVTPQVFK